MLLHRILRKKEYSCRQSPTKGPGFVGVGFSRTCNSSLIALTSSPRPHHLDLRQFGPGEVENNRPLSLKIQSIFPGICPHVAEHPTAAVWQNRKIDTKLQSFSSDTVRCHWQGGWQGLSWPSHPREVSQEIPCSRWDQAKRKELMTNSMGLYFLPGRKKALGKVTCCFTGSVQTVLLTRFTLQGLGK